ncbi:MAG: hypothetical protein O2954_10730 [bacterium]|nr:hypothetical protein [bacterium]
MENIEESPVNRRLYEIGKGWAGRHYSAETHLLGTEVRGAAAYALFLVAGGDPEDCRTAEAVVAAGGAQQETASSSPHSGWFRHSSDSETFEDPNWAAFCAAYLMHIPRAYGDRVGEACRDEIEAAVRRACAAIRKRDVSPGYTNIALLSAAVLSVGGEMYGASAYLEEGRRKLKELVAHINLTGGFQEYSSPTYYGVNFSALCWMGMFVQDEEIRDLAQRVQARLWHTVAAHFHAPTGQLGGPYGRAYGTVLQRYAGAVKYYLHKVLGDGFALGENDVHGHDTSYAGLAAIQQLACPEGALERMRNPDYPRMVEETVRTDGRALGPGYVGPFEQMTTYLADAYVLGTVNSKDCWEQRRNLLAHWVERKGEVGVLSDAIRENDAPASGRSCWFWSAQKEGKTLVLYDFSEMEEKEISAFSVVLKIEAGEGLEILVGEKAVEELPRTFAEGSTLFFRSGEAGIGVRFEAEGFLGARVSGEVRKVEGGVEVVLDLYRGEPRSFEGASLRDAFCICALEVRDAGSKREFRAFQKAFVDGALQAAVQDGRASARWRSADTVLAIEPM